MFHDHNNNFSKHIILYIKYMLGMYAINVQIRTYFHKKLSTALWIRKTEASSKKSTQNELIVFIKRQMLFLCPLQLNVRSWFIVDSTIPYFKPISNFIGWKLRLLIHLAKTQTSSYLNCAWKMVRCPQR